MTSMMSHTLLARTAVSSSQSFRHRSSPPAARLTVRSPGSQNLQRLCDALVHSSAAASRRPVVSVQASSNSAPWSPPPVSETKRKYWEQYPKPVPGIYDAVIQELLVQMHLIRYNKKYSYNPIAALGFVSVYDQILDELPKSEQDAVFKAYVEALDESPEQYRSDAQAWESWVQGLSDASELAPKEDGSEQQQLLARLAADFADKQAVYSKFLAIGLFRLLELSGAKEPKALESLVKSLNIRPEAVNRDLLTYKGVLSKLSAAKELMKEVLERERKKQAERESAKKEVNTDKKDIAASQDEDALAKKVERAAN